MRPIDADALVLEICQRNNKPYPSSFNHDFIAKGVLRDFLVCIAEAPKIDCAPVKHGEWIHDINNLYACSECLMRQTQRMRGRLMNFCPNCGASMMDGGKEHDAP